MSGRFVLPMWVRVESLKQVLGPLGFLSVPKVQEMLQSERGVSLLERAVVKSFDALDALNDDGI